MTIKIFRDYNALSIKAADEILAAVKNKPDAVLCLAAGDTPRLAYSLLAEKAATQNIDFSQCIFIGLDEWTGIPPDNEGSCHFFLTKNLFQPLGIRPAQMHLFNALSPDLDAECKKIDAAIMQKGGIDFMLVGVGMNGHIGFNEPGVPMDARSHIVDLDQTTRSVGQKYFKESTKLDKGITLGLQHFLESRTAVLLASGSKKAPVIREALEGPVTTEIPASAIQKHLHGMAIVDDDAAALLRK